MILEVPGTEVPGTFSMFAEINSPGRCRILAMTGIFVIML